MKFQPKLIRIANAIIDVAFVQFIIVRFIIDPVIAVSSNYVLYQRITPNYAYQYRLLIVLFIYYFIFELTTGRTLGKFVTKTKVVTLSGNKPDTLLILLRTFFRFIPLVDPLSFFGKEGFHDVASDTKVVKVD